MDTKRTEIEPVFLMNLRFRKVIAASLVSSRDVLTVEMAPFYKEPHSRVYSGRLSQADDDDDGVWEGGWGRKGGGQVLYD